MAGLSSLALDSAGRPYIGFYDDTMSALKSARRVGAAWTVEVVESGIEVGGYAALAVTRAGRPGVAYYDANNGDLKYATLVNNAYLPLTLHRGR
jgi:hypothetical protein